MFKKNVSILTLALITGAACAFPAIAGAGPQLPSASAPTGWTQQDGRGGSHYFLPPGATTMDVYEAIFPVQRMNGTFEDTANALWRSVVSGERIVDSKVKSLRGSDGAPTYEIIVASIDARNHGVYRVFVFKQYGANVAAGELHFNDLDRIKAIGQPAMSSLLAMSAGQIVPYEAGEVTPYHATILTTSRGGVDAAARQSGFPAELTGVWIIKVPGVAYTTTATYGSYTSSTMHVSLGAAAGYLRVTSGRRYVWYGSDGRALSSGRLVQVVPRRDASPNHTYWRVFEGREEHYLTLDADGGISIYNPATNVVTMEGTKH